MKKLFILSLIFLILMTGCAPSTSVWLSTPGPNPMANQPGAGGRVSGLGEGLWHGIISPVTLIMSLFDSNMHIYEVHNSGVGYDFGFLVGVVIVIALISFFLRMRR